MLLAISERQAAARCLLEETVEKLSDQQDFQSFGGLAEFQKKMCLAIERPDHIRQTVETQIDSLAVDKLLVDPLIY